MEDSTRGHSSRSSQERDSSDIEDRKVKYKKKQVDNRKRSDCKDRYSPRRDNEDGSGGPNSRSHSPIERHSDGKNIVKGNRKTVRDPSPRSLEDSTRGHSSRSSQERDSSDIEDRKVKYKKKTG